MKNTSIAVFGEILYDKFGDVSHLGGAPLNFACHFSMLGGEAEIISAVGDDIDGKNAVSECEKYGVDSRNIAVLKTETGHCNVTLNDGKPSYDLVFPVAYDEIPYPQKNVKSKNLYFGTLACRGEKSGNTLLSLLREGWNEVFFDINIRQKYYSGELIEKLLTYASILKTSREEINVFSEEKIVVFNNNEDFCKKITEKFKNIKLVIITLDKDGAMVYDGNGFYYSEKPKSKVKSTVGAGDSFSACFVNRYLHGDSIEKCLSKAVALSDFIVTVEGAIAVYPENLKAVLSDD